MADFSKFFNQDRPIPPQGPDPLSPEDIYSPPFSIQSHDPEHRDWDPEGTFTMEEDEPLPSVVHAPSPVETPENQEALSRFFGRKEVELPKSLPSDNVRGDLLFAATTYVNSYKSGNPITFKRVCELSGNTPKKVARAFEEEKWIKFFKEFGLEPPKLFSKDELTAEQLRCLQYVTNPLDARKLNVILKETNVSNATFRIWMRQPAFKELYTSWMRDGMKDVQGEVARQVTANATQGDPKAIETYLRLNGVNLQPTNNDVLIPFLLKKLQQSLSREELQQFTLELREITSGSSL